MTQEDQWHKEPCHESCLGATATPHRLMSDSSMRDVFQKTSILHNAIPHLDCAMKHHMYLLHTKTS